MADPVNFVVKAGLPFARRVRITNGKNLWSTLDAFEARMQIRAEKSSTSLLKYDFTPHLVKSFDGNDILVEWALTGAQTRLLKVGFYDLIVTDAGTTDDKGIQAIYGYLDLIQVITTAGGTS